MAGPPEVHPGLTITEAEAGEILARDVKRFADAVTRDVRTVLTDDQFSALVSFAYNVGPENFRKSSVLKAINARDFDAVPRRLALWVKAGGRTLPGLIARRAAEGELFAKGNGASMRPRPAFPSRRRRARSHGRARRIGRRSSPLLHRSLQALAIASLRGSSRSPASRRRRGSSRNAFPKQRRTGFF